MAKHIGIRFSQLAGLFLSASLLGACASPGDLDDEFGMGAETELDDSDEEIGEAEGGIIGGANASGPYQFPYQVRILKNGSSWCGGALLRSRWVLTAAHCVYGVSPGALVVKAGDYNSVYLDPTEQTRTVSSIRVYPSYAAPSGVPTHDVALIELSSGFSQNAAVQLISLPTGPAPVGAYGTVAGWGQTYPGSGASQLLKYTVLPIHNNSACNSAVPSLLPRALTSNEVCAGYGNGATGACHGDSGGPLVVNGQVVGIVSWGNEYYCSSYTVFADVFDYTGWIKNITGL